MLLLHQHSQALHYHLSLEDCLHCGNSHTLHRLSAVCPCGNPPSSSSHPLTLPQAETSYLMGLHSIRPMAPLRHRHALHPDRCHSCQASGLQTQRVNHSGSCHRTTSCTMPLRAGSGMPCLGMNHHDIHCKSCHDMASNTPMPTPSAPPFPSHPGSGYSMEHRLSARSPLNHRPLHTDIQ